MSSGITVPSRHQQGDPPSRSTEPAPASRARTGLQLLLYLSPVILLSTIFPLVSPRLAAAQLGGQQLSTVVLASSLTVPWLSQIGCLPIYRSLGDLIEAKDRAAVTGRFAQHWARTFALSLPVVAIFTALAGLLLRWSPTALLAYAALICLHLVFVQSLVPGNVLQRKGVWAAAWLAYALALLAMPTVWWLPPVLGTVTQLVFLRAALPQVRALRSPGALPALRDMVRGALLGSVLWADKLILFLVVGPRMDVVAVFLALLPAILAYNCYFQLYAPGVDRAVGRLRTAIHGEPYAAMTRRSAQLSGAVESAVRRTLAIGAVGAIPTALVLGAALPGSFPWGLSVLAASWLFMTVTLLTYQLDYIGRRVGAQVLCAVHLAACCLTLALLGPAGAYPVLIGVDAVLAVAAYVGYRRVWSVPEYTLFWRQALAW